MKQLRDYLINKISSSSLINEPFEHKFIEEIFPENYYQDLLAHLPSKSHYVPILKTGSVPSYYSPERFIFNLLDKNDVNKLNKEKKVEDISFEGEGCAISIASASIMTETIKGKEFNVAKKILEDFLNMLKEGSKLKINSLSEDQNTTMMSLSGVKQFPMRVKCATLAWHTFMHAVEEKKQTANTEKVNR